MRLAAFAFQAATVFADNPLEYIKAQTAAKWSNPCEIVQGDSLSMLVCPGYYELYNTA
jgi:hypothetical protein